MDALLFGHLGSSRKQKCIALYTMEAEYIAFSEQVRKLKWMRNFLLTIPFTEMPNKKITMYCDNQVAIKTNVLLMLVDIIM